MVHCQIDSIVFRNGRCFGWGWFMHPGQAAHSLELHLRAADGVTYVVACMPGGRREDVRDALPDTPHAAHSGFLITGSVPGLATEPVGGEMRARLRDGSEVVVPIPADSLSAGGGAPSSAGTPLWHRALGKIRRDGWRAALFPAKRELAALWAGIAAGIPRAWISMTKPRMRLIFDHAMGGGANRFANQLHASLAAEGLPVMYVTPLLNELRYQVALAWRGREWKWKVDDVAELLAGFDPRQPLDIHVNELVSFHQPLDVVRWCTQRRRDSPGSLTFYLHDFHAACPAWTLIGLEDRYCGLPSTAVCTECLPRNSRNSMGYNGPGVPEWRQAWTSMLDACDRIVGFSNASVEILAKAHPGIPRERVEIRPHQLPTDGIRPPALTGSATPLVVAVAGHISLPKGASILKEMAALARKRALDLRILVFGTLEEAQPGDAIEVFGEYAQGDLPGLFEAHGVSMAMLPSVCPETFSYVTAEYMAMDVPVAVFPIGAPAERVAGYAKGLVISDIDAAIALDEIMSFAARGFRAAPAHG